MNSYQYIDAVPYPSDQIENSTDGLDRPFDSTTAYIRSYDAFLPSDNIGAAINYVAVPDINVGGAEYLKASDSNGFYADTTDNGPIHVVVTSSASAIPEPASLAGLLVGAGAFAGVWRRRA